jgi:hypothetical protein
MQTSIDRLAPEEGNTTSALPVVYVQVPTISRSFTTPPPRSSTTLSPIPEVTNPFPTPQTSQAQHFPPSLGTLAPEQLPHQPCTQHARRNDSSYTYTPPIITTMAASTLQRQLSQYATPLTQPQYYQLVDQQNHTFTTTPPQQQQFCPNQPPYDQPYTQPFQ